MLMRFYPILYRAFPKHHIVESKVILQPYLFMMWRKIRLVLLISTTHVSLHLTNVDILDFRLIKQKPIMKKQ